MGYKVQCNLNQLMARERHKIMDVHNATGISRVTLTQMYKDESKAIRFDNLAKLCELYKCQISDLLELVEDE